MDIYFFFFNIGDSIIIICTVWTGIEPPDAQREKEGIAALQARERKVDHSVSAARQMPQET